MENNLQQRIGLGCMGTSSSRNPEESMKTIRAALDEGITLFNTGEFYGMGESEMIVGIPFSANAMAKRNYQTPEIEEVKTYSFTEGTKRSRS